MNQTKNRNALLASLKSVGPSDINSVEEFELIKKLTDMLSQKDIKRKRKKRTMQEQESASELEK